MYWLQRLVWSKISLPIKGLRRYRWNGTNRVATACVTLWGEPYVGITLMVVWNCRTARGVELLQWTSMTAGGVSLLAMFGEHIHLHFAPREVNELSLSSSDVTVGSYPHLIVEMAVLCSLGRIHPPATGVG